MDWTKYEINGYKPSSFFDDGFPGVPTETKWGFTEWAEAIASIVLLGIGIVAFVFTVMVGQSI